MNKDAEYRSKYQNKNIDKIREKDKERKKFERKYVKYCEEKKYEGQMRSNKDRERIAKKRKRKLEQIDQLSPVPTR